MPYIPQDLRVSALQFPVGSGELNYKITMTILEYLDRNRLCYATINEVVGALECAKAEFQRRLVAPYEDCKIRENGEIYYDRIR